MGEKESESGKRESTWQNDQLNHLPPAELKTLII